MRFVLPMPQNKEFTKSYKTVTQLVPVQTNKTSKKKNRIQLLSTLTENYTKC